MKEICRAKVDKVRMLPPSSLFVGIDNVASLETPLVDNLASHKQ